MPRPPPSSLRSAIANAASDKPNTRKLTLWARPRALNSRALMVSLIALYPGAIAPSTRNIRTNGAPPRPAVKRALCPAGRCGSPDDTTRAPRLEKSPLHWVTGKSRGRFEMLACGFLVTTPQFELAERCEVEWIGEQTVLVRNRRYGFKALSRSVPLAYCDTSIQCHDWRRANREQHIVERNDGFPVRLFGARRAGVGQRYRRLNVILRDLGTLGRLLEQQGSLADQIFIPFRSILFRQ